MPRLPTGPDITPTYIYNPLSEDFTVLLANDDRSQTPYTILSRQIDKFPKYIADHITKHLAQKIALADVSGLTYEIRYRQAEDKIIKIDI